MIFGELLTDRGRYTEEQAVSAFYHGTIAWCSARDSVSSSHCMISSHPFDFALISVYIDLRKFSLCDLKSLSILQIRRSHLIADSLRQLGDQERDFKKPLKVHTMSFYLLFVH
jgi:hypothetical protein